MADPLVVIVGETGSGKSSLGLKLAQRFNGEIICADAWTVRREANIGTAKPSKPDQALIPHHLLDTIGPNQTFTAADFKKRAHEAIQGITARGKLPIMVGGTGLYIDSFLYDYSFLRTEPGVSREELNALSLTALQQKLRQAGLEIGGLDLSNKRRLVRALETGGAAASKKPLRPHTLIIGLTNPREVLKERLTARVDAMLAAGLESEARRLKERYGLACEALKGIGYSEWQDYFLGSIDEAAVRSQIIKDSVALAKRQRTWFKRNKSIHWFSTPVKWLDIVELTTTYLNS